MDTIEKLLASLDVRVEPFAVCDVSSGCHLDILADEVCSIHYVLSGEGRLIAKGHETIELSSDQIVLIPAGVPQRIVSNKTENASSSDNSICLQPSENLKWLKSGNGDSDLVLACGRIHASYGTDTDIFGLLAAPLVEAFHHSSRIRTAFESILHEFCEPRVGTIALTSALMKQCLIILLRQLHEAQDKRLPWVGALENQGLMRAIVAMINLPEKPYKIEDLADIAIMSRSSFVEQFSRTLGQPPHEFLSHYRLRRAASLLSVTNLPVKTIANKVGFQSRSSFSRAFKANYHIDPAGYRNKQLPK